MGQALAFGFFAFAADEEAFSGAGLDSDLVSGLCFSAGLASLVAAVFASAPSVLTPAGLSASAPFLYDSVR